MPSMLCSCSSRSPRSCSLPAPAISGTPPPIAVRAPYTTFYARRAVFEAKRDELLRLVRGLYRTQKWLHAASPDALADTVQPYFPAVPQPLLRAAVGRYRKLGIWGRNPILPRGGYERLAAGLVSGAFVPFSTPFETAVDNRFAEQSVRDDPPSL